jgi:hypothetical protein
MAGNGEHKQVHLTIVLDGKPHPVNARGDSLVIDVIREALGPTREAEAENYDLVPEGAPALDPSQTLDAAGVTDRSVLSLNKKDGGGA